MLIKGALHTDVLLHEVVQRETGLRTERRLSHAFIMDVPTYHKPLVLTDCAINIYPTLEDKVSICQNAIDLAHTLGVALPKVAVLSAVETVNPKITATLEAAALCKMADRGQITGGLVDGPLAMDNAISKTAAEVKHIRSEVAGDADVLVVPDLEAGNMLAKQLTFMANADAAGIVLGARVPIVLTSRSDNVQTRLASCAVGLLLAHARRTGLPGGGDIRRPRRQGGAMTRVIGVLNAGSSSVKFSVFAVAGADLRRLYRGEFEGIGTAPHFFVSDADGAIVVDERDSLAEVATQEDAVHRIFTWVELPRRGPGGRGGRPPRGPWRADLLRAGRDRRAHARRPGSLRAARPVPPAPQPRPHPRTDASHRPGLTQVACFDTAFHRTAPLVAEVYALPREYFDAGVRRYGFHGLSFEYVTQALRALDPVAAAGRVVIAHLGNGCSMAAVLAGKSLGDTMGFTALDGLPMGTRCGQIDPGVLIYLLQQRGMSVDQVEDLLYNHSGLKGLSGVSNDMRDLLASDVPDARLAVDYFVDRIGRELGSLAAVLKGLDALVFTGGIGEHAAEVRARVCRDAAWLGVTLDDEANRRGGPRISPGGRVPLGLGHPDR